MLFNYLIVLHQKNIFFKFLLLKYILKKHSFIPLCLFSYFLQKDICAIEQEYCKFVHHDVM